MLVLIIPEFASSHMVYILLVYCSCILYTVECISGLSNASV